MESNSQYSHKLQPKVQAFQDKTKIKVTNMVLLLSNEHENQNKKILNLKHILIS